MSESLRRWWPALPAALILYWGGADFVGSSVRVNGKPHTVIGIAPEGFSGISGLLAPEVWLPLGLHTELNSAFSDSGQAPEGLENLAYRNDGQPDARSGPTICTMADFRAGLSECIMRVWRMIDDDRRRQPHPRG